MTYSTSRFRRLSSSAGNRPVSMFLERYLGETSEQMIRSSVVWHVHTVLVDSSDERVGKEWFPSDDFVRGPCFPVSTNSCKGGVDGCLLQNVEID